MEVSVERYQRKKYVNQENSPMLYYIRQKAGTAKVMDIDALAEDIQTNCALTTGDVKHTIEALVEQLRKVLTQGNKVKIEGLGTFHMTLTCLPGETEKECTVKNIKRVNVRFIPDKAMKPGERQPEHDPKPEQRDVCHGFGRRSGRRRKRRRGHCGRPDGMIAHHRGH